MGFTVFGAINRSGGFLKIEIIDADGHNVASLNYPDSCDTSPLSVQLACRMMHASMYVSVWKPAGDSGDIRYSPVQSCSPPQELPLNTRQRFLFPHVGVAALRLSLTQPGLHARLSAFFLSLFKLILVSLCRPLALFCSLAPSLSSLSL